MDIFFILLLLLICSAHNTLLFAVMILLLLFLAYQRHEFFIQSDPVLDSLQQQLKVLHPRLENIRIYPANKSYTMNKNKIYICMKDENGEYYPRNMLVYVICHEYSHVLCDEIDHTEKFKNIFHNMLRKATRLGFYDPTIQPIQNYCGT
jgi:hypothetical protein